MENIPHKVRNSRELALPRLYAELVDWFHLLTCPEEYRDEADFYRRVILENSSIPVKTVLELGSGGGNNASHLKSHFEMTLTDISMNMLEISRRINPECEHVKGDMRSLRLGRQFDAVFVHDAVSYLITEKSLAQAMETAFVHCRPGGAVLFAPDYTRETFAPMTDVGGHDVENRGLRYLSWVYDPDPEDTVYTSEMVYLMRDGDGVRCENESHILGLFSGETWLSLINQTGFTGVKAVPYPAEITEALSPVFTGVRPE